MYLTIHLRLHLRSLLISSILPVIPAPVLVGLKDLSILKKASETIQAQRSYACRYERRARAATPDKMRPGSSLQRMVLNLNL